MPDVPPVFRRTAPKTKKGGSAHLRDHSAAYARLRASLLQAEPLCRYDFNNGLIVPAEVLDHILALSLGGSNDPANLAPSCRGCNDAKSLDERRYLQRGYDPGDVRFDPAMARWFSAAVKRPPIRSPT